MRSLGLALLAAALFSCDGRVSSESPFVAGPVDELRLRRTECYGYCPADETVFYRDGRASYSARANLPRRGDYDGHVSPQEVQQLFAEIQHAGFSSLPRESGSAKNDGADHVVSVVRNGVRQSVVSHISLTPAMQRIVDAFERERERTHWIAVDSGIEIAVQVRRRDGGSVSSKLRHTVSWPASFDRENDLPDATYRGMTDKEGKLRMPLRPGRYVISIRPQDVPTASTVVPHSFIRRDISLMVGGH
jgi:hypothetical protein